jgi:hypothetical protein
LTVGFVPAVDQDQKGLLGRYVEPLENLRHGGTVRQLDMNATPGRT